MSRFLDEDDFGDDYFDNDDTDPTPPPTRRRGSWWKNLLAIVISLAVLVGGGYFVYSKVKDVYQGFTSVSDYPGPGEQDVLVTIPDGATLTDMADVLVQADVVASKKAFVKAAGSIAGSSGIQPGTYQLKTKMQAADAVTALMDRANMVNTQVTIPEGLRDSVLTERLSEQTGIPVADFEAVLADPSQLKLPDWANGKPEGFLFPETYVYDTEPTAAEILAEMTSHFGTVADQIAFVNKANSIGVSPYDALIVASIIEKETRDPAYGPDIAQVLYNRLGQGMKLQLDSTVIYAVNSPGTITTTDDERANPSPYNTYMHEGLPPGPISNPGKNALESAVNPTHGSYLYFVAVNPDTGETKFASDYEGHSANEAQFHAWCQANADQCG
ncbi:endolytic transglycosylase MltG [Brooklawnia sp.]|uniref:endolytic transglycosylase MltG n=1 Tax=Brooklawnia sp. TaxID=2699740 RepID=UPI00311F3A54